MRITRIVFRHYKAFENFSVTLSNFDVLVGPNNSGKSTILGAVRILSEGIRKANAKNPERTTGPDGIPTWGYNLNLKDIPVSLENVFHNYDDTATATITFYIENDNRLILFFPEKDTCFLIPVAEKVINSTSAFKRHFPLKVGFVPVLGPVEHKEELYQKEAARKALLTHRASRNFRNIWYHYPEGFENFREMIRSTWPGMDIDPPEVINEPGEKPRLVMFCPEERIPREIYWAGFGFQVWCQMLTFILQAKGASMLVIDEPDIYLHSDLQRQLVNILRDLDLQILIATHSIEIITEVEAHSLLTIHKRRQSATRISNPKELQAIYQLLGSNVNPTLTQLAKTRRVLFLEGKDFQLLSLFARKLRYNNLANRSDFAVVPVEGFNPQKVRDFSKGMEITLGTTLLRGVIFDRDYRSHEEVTEITKELSKTCYFAVIHERKEIENFLLQPAVLDRAIQTAVKKRTGENSDARAVKIRTSEEILNDIAEELRTEALPQYLARRREFLKRKTPALDPSTIDKQGLTEFEGEWQSLEGRLKLIPGKEVISRFNALIQQEYGVALTVRMIVDAFRKDDIPDELISLIEKLKAFSTAEKQ